MSAMKTLLLLGFIFILGADAGGRLRLSEEEDDLELERQLRVINKPAVKSFKTGCGAVIDCVDMYKQLAFDHPLLKNHTIQMKPEHVPKVPARKTRGMPSLELGWRCPQGSVPVVRATKEDLLMSKFIPRHTENYPSAEGSPNSAVIPGLHSAMIVHRRGTRGAKATINNWAPMVQPKQFSLAKVSLNGGYGADQNNIQAGWMSYDYLYPNSTRVFTYWTADAYQKTGCYNLLCPGFVQVSSTIPVGFSVLPSTYGGPQIFFRFSIVRDGHKGHWWLRINDEDVGYWPRSLFTSLVDSADSAAWGGQVFSPPGTPTPEMGSGHFPSEGFGKAASMIDLLVSLPLRSRMFVPPDTHNFFLVDAPRCYYPTSDKNDDDGRYILYGGPGGCRDK